MSCAHSLHLSDLQAALEAEPDNPEAKALLHQRSVTVEKVIVLLYSQFIWHLGLELRLVFRNMSSSCLRYPNITSRNAYRTKYGGKLHCISRGEI